MAIEGSITQVLPAFISAEPKVFAPTIVQGPPVVLPVTPEIDGPWDAQLTVSWTALDSHYLVDLVHSDGQATMVIADEGSLPGSP